MRAFRPGVYACFSRRANAVFELVAATLAEDSTSSPPHLSLATRQPRLARRRIESSERLGRHRWVVERMQAWLLVCRRPGVGYERRADPLQGQLHLASALLCLRSFEPATEYE